MYWAPLFAVHSRIIAAVLARGKSGLFFELPEKVFCSVISTKRSNFIGGLAAAAQQVLRIIGAALNHVLC